MSTPNATQMVSYSGVFDRSIYVLPDDQQISDDELKKHLRSKKEERLKKVLLNTAQERLQLYQSIGVTDVGTTFARTFFNSVFNLIPGMGQTVQNVEREIFPISRDEARNKLFELSFEIKLMLSGLDKEPICDLENRYILKKRSIPSQDLKDEIESILLSSRSSDGPMHFYRKFIENALQLSNNVCSAKNVDIASHEKFKNFDINLQHSIKCIADKLITDSKTTIYKGGTCNRGIYYFYGNPSTGKSTIAQLIPEFLDLPFHYYTIRSSNDLSRDNLEGRNKSFDADNPGLLGYALLSQNSRKESFLNTVLILEDFDRILFSEAGNDSLAFLLDYLDPEKIEFFSPYFLAKINIAYLSIIITANQSIPKKPENPNAKDPYAALRSRVKEIHFPDFPIEVIKKICIPYANQVAVKYHIAADRINVEDWITEAINTQSKQTHTIELRDVKKQIEFVVINELQAQKLGSLRRRMDIDDNANKLKRLEICSAFIDVKSNAIFKNFDKTLQSDLIFMVEKFDIDSRAPESIKGICNRGIYYFYGNSDTGKSITAKLIPQLLDLPFYVSTIRTSDDLSKANLEGEPRSHNLNNPGLLGQVFLPKNNKNNYLNAILILEGLDQVLFSQNGIESLAFLLDYLAPEKKEFFSPYFVDMIDISRLSIIITSNQSIPKKPINPNEKDPYAAFRSRVKEIHFPDFPENTIKDICLPYAENVGKSYGIKPETISACKKDWVDEAIKSQSSLMLRDVKSQIDVIVKNELTAQYAEFNTKQKVVRQRLDTVEKAPRLSKGCFTCAKVDITSNTIIQNFDSSLQRKLKFIAQKFDIDSTSTNEDICNRGFYYFFGNLDTGKSTAAKLIPELLDLPFFFSTIRSSEDLSKTNIEGGPNNPGLLGHALLAQNREKQSCLNSVLILEDFDSVFSNESLAFLLDYMNPQKKEFFSPYFREKINISRLSIIFTAKQSIPKKPENPKEKDPYGTFRSSVREIHFPDFPKETIHKICIPYAEEVGKKYGIDKDTIEANKHDWIKKAMSTQNNQIIREVKSEIEFVVMNELDALNSGPIAKKHRPNTDK